MLILFDFLWESKTPCRLSLYIQSDGVGGRVWDVSETIFRDGIDKIKRIGPGRCGHSSMQIEMSKLKHHLERKKKILLFCL